MDYLNDSDLNASARIEIPSGSVTVPAHLRGYADRVTVESVPSAQGQNELLVLFRAEAGYTGAALRVEDLVRVLAKHYPDMLTQALTQVEEDDSDDE